MIKNSQLGYNDFFWCLRPWTKQPSGKNKKNQKKFFWHFCPPGVPPPHPHISATGQLIKNRLDGPKTMPMVTLHVKFQVFMMIRLGCTVWWVGKWHIASYNPSEPVDNAQIQTTEMVTKTWNTLPTVYDAVTGYWVLDPLVHCLSSMLPYYYELEQRKSVEHFDYN